MEFDKFYIKRKSWFSSGNFNIYDENNELIYIVKSNVWEFRKKFRFCDINKNTIYTIKTLNSFGTSYNLLENGKVIALVEKPMSLSNTVFKISTTITGPFIAEGNVWSNEYKFKRGESEIGIVSYKIWSAGDFGIAIKQGEPSSLLLSVVIIIGYLKENGAA